MSPIDRAHKAIENLGELTAGWDSYDAEPIPEVARRRAIRCLMEVADSLGPAYAEPEVGPIPSPGVGLSWKRPGLVEVHALITSDSGRYLVLGCSGEQLASGPLTDYGTFARTILKKWL
jgi:hypothetical protein